MLFDPDIELTTEELLARTWDRLRPDQQALFQREADARGCTVWDLLVESVNEFVRYLQDPEHLCAYLARLDRQESPFGRDPKLSQEA